jgi:hypothetical protein
LASAKLHEAQVHAGFPIGVIVLTNLRIHLVIPEREIDLAVEIWLSHNFPNGNQMTAHP